MERPKLPKALKQKKEFKRIFRFTRNEKNIINILLAYLNMDFDTYVRSHLIIDANKFGLRFDVDLERFIKKIERMNKQIEELKEKQKS